MRAKVYVRFRRNLFHKNSWGTTVVEKTDCSGMAPPGWGWGVPEVLMRETNSLREGLRHARFLTSHWQRGPHLTGESSGQLSRQFR
jgi:hypothetical protein